MSERRIDTEDLGGLSALPPDDPRRRALETSPGARARLRAYEEFVAPTAPPDAAHLAEAEARLAEVIDREVGIPGAASGSPTAAPARAGRVVRGPSGWFAAPWLRPVAAAAVLAVVIGGAWMLARPQRDGGDVMRGGRAPAPGAWSADTRAEPLAGGSLRLRWNAARGADRYAAVFHAADYTEIGRVDGIVATQLDLAPATRPEGLTAGATVLWRVVAYRGADEIGRSPADVVTIP